MQARAGHVALAPLVICAAAVAAPSAMARSEEEVFYPAALLVGELVRVQAEPPAAP